jgi:hypothetical protein
VLGDEIPPKNRAQGVSHVNDLGHFALLENKDNEFG